MRHLFLAAILACVSMQASAMVVEPQKEPAPSTKSVKQKTASTPTKTMLAPPSKATIQFFQALRNGNFQIMDMLLDQGADINCKNCNSKGQTPLMFAMEHPASGNTISESVRYLVEKGADLNTQDNDGSTAIMYGKGFNPYWSHAYQVLYLIENGAKTTIKDGSGNNILHYAWRIQEPTATVNV